MSAGFNVLVASLEFFSNVQQSFALLPLLSESKPVSEGHGSGTDIALEEEGDELGSVETEELNAEADRLLQSIGLQNSGIDPDLPDCEPQAVPKTSNSDLLAGPQPVSAWYRGQYPLHQHLHCVNRRAKEEG